METPSRGGRLSSERTPISPPHCQSGGLHQVGEAHCARVFAALRLGNGWVDRCHWASVRSRARWVLQWSSAKAPPLQPPDGHPVRTGRTFPLTPYLARLPNFLVLRAVAASYRSPILSADFRLCGSCRFNKTSNKTSLAAPLTSSEHPSAEVLHQHQIAARPINLRVQQVSFIRRHR